MTIWSVAYLWGIETIRASCSPPFFQLSVAYLWGIETPATCLAFLFLPLSVAYLWGIETRFLVQELLWWNPVCSLPMRDWNAEKQSWVKKSYHVCSLPMRDWNWVPSTHSHLLHSGSVAYLWGIETLLSDGLSLPAFAVCSLPMRDWN